MRRRLALCASDGVWHCMTDDEAIETVERTLSKVALSVPPSAGLRACLSAFVGVRKITRFCAHCSLITQTFAARMPRRRSSCRHTGRLSGMRSHARAHACACEIESGSAYRACSLSETQ